MYNSQGKSKGMAVVWFQRPGDAAVARAKYDGKIVDGRELQLLLWWTRTFAYVYFCQDGL